MAIAAEWQWQHSRIDPNTMPLMSLAATAIDMPQSRETVADTIVSYLSTDPVVCRVPEEDTDLFKMQGEIFDPVLDWICHELNVELEKTSSIFGAQLQPRDVAMIRNHILGMYVVMNCLFMWLFVCFFACLFVSLHVCLFLWLFVCFCGCLFVSLHVCLFLWLFVSLCGCLFVSVVVCLFVCIFVYLFLSFSLYLFVCLVI